MITGKKPLKPVGKLKPRFTHDCDTCLHLATIRLHRWFDLYFCERCDGGTLIARFSSEGPDYSSYPVDVWETARNEYALVMCSEGSYRDFRTGAQRNMAIEFAYVEYLRIKDVRWRSWEIVYQDREYAREKGDPCLGVVEALSAREAVRIANRKGMGNGYAAVMAVHQKNPL